MLYEIFTIGNMEWKFIGDVSVKVVFLSRLYFDGLLVLPGGSPYPRMDGRKIANLLQDGYRMPKPQHVDEEL